MTRDERIYAMAKVLAREIRPGKTTLRRLATIALDAADATRPPCDCRQCNLDRLANGGGL